MDHLDDDRRDRGDDGEGLEARGDDDALDLPGDDDVPDAPGDVDVGAVVAGTDAPAAATVEVIDVRDLPPPGPLSETLERLAAVPDGTVLLQANDRVPQHLLPRLDERDYRYESVEDADVVLTAIW